MSSFLCFLIIIITLISGLSFYSIIHGASNVSLADNAMNLAFSSVHSAVIPVVLPVTEGDAASNDSPNPSAALSNDFHSITTHDSHNNKGKLLDTKKTKRLQVAFAITITRDGKFQDGAAVMAYSIDKAFRDDNMDISMVAFVHPNVTTSRPFLERVGYR